MNDLFKDDLEDLEILALERLARDLQVLGGEVRNLVKDAGRGEYRAIHAHIVYMKLQQALGLMEYVIFPGHAPHP